MSEMQKSYGVVNPYNFIPFEAEPDRQPQGSWYPDPKKLDFKEFVSRAAEYRRRLIHSHVNCAPLK
jgi:hypothetical protein